MRPRPEIPHRFELLAGLIAAALLNAGCLATIPPPPLEAVATRATLPTLPPLEPCVLLNGEWTQSLADGAHGADDVPWQQVAISVLLPHASGPVLIDASIGRGIAEEYAEAPFWFRSALGDWSKTKPTADLLKEVGVDPAKVTRVVSTHVHWDHVGGLRDLPNARPLFWSRDIDWALTLEDYVESGVMPHQLRAVEKRIERYEMDGPAYEGFPASHDVLGDGSLIAVPLPGHTPGSTAFFVNSGDGRRWLFTGDATWTVEGIRRPAHKSRLASLLVDHDDEVSAQSIALLHAFHRARPELVLVPAHDMEAVGKLPRCRR